MIRQIRRTNYLPQIGPIAISLTRPCWSYRNRESWPGWRTNGGTKLEPVFAVYVICGMWTFDKPHNKSVVAGKKRWWWPFWVGRRQSEWHLRCLGHRIHHFHYYLHSMLVLLCLQES